MRSEVNAISAGSLGAGWESKGYFGGGNVEEILDSLSGQAAIIAGSAKGVFDEVEAATAILQRVNIFAVNDVGVILPHVDHFVSLHTPKLVHWVELRRDETSAGYGNRDFRVHDGGLYDKREWYQWKALTPTMSLSGMFAAQIAYLMGCHLIVLCGVPCDSTPRYWETGTSTKNTGYQNSQRQIREEMAYKPNFKSRVRSMSGWSREFFGTL
jgi:hypothetical protein